MGLSEGTRVLGTPLLMLPPGTEPRDVPLSTDVSWAMGTPKLSGGPAWPRGDSCSCFTPLKGAGDKQEW